MTLSISAALRAAATLLLAAFACAASAQVTLFDEPELQGRKITVRADEPNLQSRWAFRPRDLFAAAGHGQWCCGVSGHRGRAASAGAGPAAEFLQRRAD